jgi:hypothetical protein
MHPGPIRRGHRRPARLRRAVFPHRRPGPPCATSLRGVPPPPPWTALRDFAARCSPTAALDRPVLPVLFALVDTPAEQDGVRILPVATLMGAG